MSDFMETDGASRAIVVVYSVQVAPLLLPGLLLEQETTAKARKRIERRNMMRRI